MIKTWLNYYNKWRPVKLCVLGARWCWWCLDRDRDGVGEVTHCYMAGQPERQWEYEWSVDCLWHHSAGAGSVWCPGTVGPRHQHCSHLSPPLLSSYISSAWQTSQNNNNNPLWRTARTMRSSTTAATTTTRWTTTTTARSVRTKITTASQELPSSASMATDLSTSQSQQRSFSALSVPSPPWMLREKRNLHNLVGCGVCALTKYVEQLGHHHHINN